MWLFKQLELNFVAISTAIEQKQAVARQGVRLADQNGATAALCCELSPAADRELQQQASWLLQRHGAGPIASIIRVEWNRRLKTCAGRADYKAKLISLNPLLRDHGREEINRTLLHELAHLLAQFRAGRRRILPHGREWQRACADLGIGDEKRCHNLPFPVSQRARRFLYRCPNCRKDIPRVRRIRRAMACLACCRAHNRGEFDKRFRLRLINCGGAQ